jgi:peptide/nickel transport system permease protein
VAAFLVRRLLLTILVLFGVSLITFTLAYIIPGDPAREMAGPRASLQVVQQIRGDLGLDRPAPLQYLQYIGRLAQGDLGTSWMFSRPVGQAILERLPATLQLALAATVLELFLGLPIGLAAALHHGRWQDRALMIPTLLGVCAPSFWVGLLLLYSLAFQLPIFPLGGYGTPMHVVLPALTVALIGGPWYARMLRSSVLDVLGMDYVRTARAKGLRASAVIARHVLRNSMAPILTMAGMDFGRRLGGLLVVETVFGWPGIGTLLLTAINELDVPVIMGTVLIGAAFTVSVNLLVDLLYATLDPRVRYA